MVGRGVQKGSWDGGVAVLELGVYHPETICIAWGQIGLRRGAHIDKRDDELSNGGLTSRTEFMLEEMGWMGCINICIKHNPPP